VSHLKTLPIFAALLLAALLMAQNDTEKSSKQQNKNIPPAAQPIHPVERQQPVTGKTGSHAKALNTSTTKSTGVTTPGVETTNGIVQQPGEHPTLHPVNPGLRSAPGAPPNWEQIGQDEQLANSNAAAAYRAEIGGPEGTLGVAGAMPSYSKSGKVSKPAPPQ
jgi:hypothetical protein